LESRIALLHSLWIVVLIFVKVSASYAIEYQGMVAAYNVSKKLSEQATWKFMEDQKPNFDLTVINPDIIIGPMIQPVAKAGLVNETNRFAVYNFFNGPTSKLKDSNSPFIILYVFPPKFEGV
jgi:hypothetical protein